MHADDPNVPSHFTKYNMTVSNLITDLTSTSAHSPENLAKIRNALNEDGCRYMCALAECYPRLIDKECQICLQDLTDAPGRKKGVQLYFQLEHETIRHLGFITKQYGGIYTHALLPNKKRGICTHALSQIVCRKQRENNLDCGGCYGGWVSTDFAGERDG